MERHRIATIAATSVIAVGLGTMCHEQAHVWVGRLVGGTPTLLTSTEVKGNFDSLSPAGFAAFGAAGSIVNLAFCAIGWWILRRRPASAESRLFGWYFFGVNGMYVTTKMVGEPLAGFGDWMTILHRLPALPLLRGLAAILGLAGLAFMVRRSGAELARLIPPGEPAERNREALRILLLGAIAAGVLLLGGSVLNPVGPVRAIPLALGAGLGPFVALAFGLRFVGRVPSTRPPGTMKSNPWPWSLAAAAIALVLWFLVGPGVVLSNAPL
jgi:hypothetical protein